VSRELSAAVLALAESGHLERTAMVHFAFDEDVYVHSGLGEITWNGNTYVGIGMLGNISEQQESQALTVQPITFSLSGLDQQHLRVALDAANYGDQITLYEAFIDDAGDLIADPVVIWAGSVDSTSVRAGMDSAISIVGQHDIADIDKSDGARFTNEDQQARYPGDEFFEFIHEVPTLKLFWGGGHTATGVRPGPGPHLDYSDLNDPRGQG
jgi:hypothetical protein